MAEHVHHSPVIVESEHPMVSFPTVMARLINLFFGIIIAFIIMRMLLLLLGANQGNAFVDFVYSVSAVFTVPFYGVFGSTPVYGTATFDLSSLVAIIVYALIDWAIVSLVTINDHHETA